MDNEEDVLSRPCRSLIFRASPRLRQLHDTLNKLIEEKEALQTRLSEELGMSFKYSANRKARNLSICAGHLD